MTMGVWSIFSPVVVYAFGRSYLLMEAFAGLRNLKENAYLNVNYTSFMNHTYIARSIMSLLDYLLLMFILYFAKSAKSAKNGRLFTIFRRPLGSPPQG